MDEFKLEDWFPMSPLKGPPLPRFLGIYWPWYKEIDVILPPIEPGQTRIYGKVTDARGEGVVAANVSVTWTGEPFTWSVSKLSDPSGYYLLTGLIPGNYVLEASKSGFETSSSYIVLYEGDNRHNIKLSGGI